MWNGGVRVIVLDEDNRILMVKQDHPERVVWMVPGGGIEDGEDSRQAGLREVKEETGLDVDMKGLLWHMEETGDRGQRFVNFYLAKADSSGSENKPELGSDPELAPEQQVLKEVRFMSREEISALENVYPEWIKDRFWNMLEEGRLEYDAFIKRTGLF